MILISPFPFYFNYVILQERTIFKRTVSLAGNEPSFFTYLESNFSLNLTSGYAIVNTKGKPEKRPTLKQCVATAKGGQPSLFAVVAAIFFYIENLIAKTYKGNNEDTKLE